MKVEIIRSHRPGKPRKVPPVAPTEPEKTDPRPVRDRVSFARQMARSEFADARRRRS